jgi:hypothetical protein
MRRDGNCRTGLLIGLPLSLLMWAGILSGGSAILRAQGPQTALVIGSALDAGSTIYALHTNPRAHEANPMLAHGGTVGVLAGKVATTAALTWAIQRMAPSHPRVAKVIGYGGGAVLGGLAARNVAVAGK